ncbi:MAG: hypothetical protein H0V82_08205 [Candidatus Protochlamydia sp.]|nr:hypothetical protein [Candidatus Protochlamydia sp.]
MAKEEEEREHLISEFMHHNSTDFDLEKKVIFFQRHIRAKVRHDAEIDRIGNLYFKHETISIKEQKAISGIEEANTPYRPKKCNPELADKIMRLANEVKLYSSVRHLTATDNIATILDNCLLGRKNLINHYLQFRPAALFSSDVTDGDLNVICFGPDEIDSKCLRERTIGMDFDLEIITKDNKNPNIFFKQKDFGFSTDLVQSIEIGQSEFYFSHCKILRCGDMHSINLQFLNQFTERLEYYAELPKYLFISYNVPEMDKILTLNFFRFIDSLKNTNCMSAPNKINYIYEKIEELSDEELLAFLTSIGRKLSCTSEFNFSGAYKIDLNALTHLSFFEKQKKVGLLEINNLCEQLNCGNQDGLNSIKKFAPEILDSKRFIEHLNSKLNENVKLTIINKQA